MLFLPVFPGDLADFFAQKFVSSITSVLDSRLSAGRDIYPDLFVFFVVFAACAKLC